MVPTYFTQKVFLSISILLIFQVLNNTIVFVIHFFFLKHMTYFLKFFNLKLIPIEIKIVMYNFLFFSSFDKYLCSQVCFQFSDLNTVNFNFDHKNNKKL